MHCIMCNVDVKEKPLYRTNPLGQSPAGWMCMDCIQKNHPELAANIREDRSDFERDINKIFYPTSKS
jgi:hypothetical protein